MIKYSYVAVALLSTLSATADVTRKTVCARGCDYAASGAGLQSAVDTCRTLKSTDPCIIEIRAGSKIAVSTPIVLNPQQNRTKWIVIRSSRIGELADGRRVTASDAPKMATIQNTGASQVGVFITPPNTTGAFGSAPPSHYRFEGLEVYYSGEGASYGGAISMGLGGDGATQATQLWQVPRHIVIDRCWLHGMPAAKWLAGGTSHALVNGTRADAADVTIKNTLISDIHMDSSVTGAGETHGIHVVNSPGPIYVYNNRLEATIGSITGGAGWRIPGVIATGTYYFGNEYTRDPADWHWQDWNSPGVPIGDLCTVGSFYEERFAGGQNKDCPAGTWQAATTTRRNRDWQKNGWECKNCRLAVVEGNYVHDIPATGDQSQPGHAFLMNLVDAYFGAPWARPEYMTFRYNRARRTGQGFITSTQDDGKEFAPLNHITIEHNVIESMTHPTVSPANGPFGGGTAIDITQVKNYSLRHNTIMKYGTAGGTPVRTTGIVGSNANIAIQDNIIFWGMNGFFRNATTLGSAEGCRAFVEFWSGSRDLRNNAIVDTNSRGGPSGWWSTWYGNGSGCVASSYVANWAAVRFTNYADENGTYSLTAGSPLHNRASDGTDPGVDWTQYMSAQSGVAEGTPDFHWWEFRIRRADPKKIVYTAYDSGPCSGTVNRIANGSTDYTWTDGGGSRERSTTPSGLSAGIAYRARITCSGGRARDMEFVAY